MIDRGGLAGQVGGGGGDVLGGRAGPVETDQAVDLVAGSPAVDPRARGRHHPGQVMAGDGGPALRPGQLVGRDRGGAHLHEQFSRPRIGDGDRLAGQAGRVGVRCAHGEHRADGIVNGSVLPVVGARSPGQPLICAAGSTPCSRHQARYTARWVSAFTDSMTSPSSPRYSMVPATLMYTTHGSSPTAPHPSRVPAGS